MNRVTITKEQKPWDDYQGAFENGKFIYYDFLENEDGEWIKDKKYSFRFTDEKFHQYETLIVTPKVLVVLSNETGLSEKALKKYKPKAIITVDLYGNSCDYESIHYLAEKYDAIIHNEYAATMEDKDK